MRIHPSLRPVATVGLLAMVVAACSTSATGEPSAATSATPVPSSAAPSATATPSFKPFDHGEIPDEIVGSYSFEVFDKPSLIDLEPDGTYVLMTPGAFGGENTVEVTGEYGVFGDEMRFGNEVAAHGRACLGDGVYTWSLDEGTLTLTLVEDECSAAINRMAEWQSGWTRID